MLAMRLATLAMSGALCGVSVAAGSDMMGHWPFDGSLRDASDQGRDAAGATQYAPGHSGQALAPDWRPVEVADAADLRLAPGLTIDCWVYWDQGATGYEQIVLKDQEYQLRVDAPAEGGRFAFFVYLDGWEPRVNGPQPEPGQWYHLVASWSGTETCLKVDGVAYSTRRMGNLAPTDNAVQMGNMSGRLDELVISNPNEARSRELRALTAQVTDGGRVTAAHLDGSQGWREWAGTSGAEITHRGEALEARLTGETGAVVHPALDVDLTGLPILSLDLDAAGAEVATVSFLTDQGEGALAFPAWGGGRTSYANLSALPAWSGRLKLLAFSFPDAQPERVAVRGVWLSNQPEGRPYLYVRNLAPGRAALRAGREETVIAVVRNLGRAASDVTVALEAPAGVAVRDEPARQIGPLDNDGTAKVTWRVRARRAGPAALQVRVSAPDAEPQSRELECRFTEPLDLPQAEYVPEPKPVTSPYLTLMHYCPLWKEGTHYGWEKIEAWPERRPAIGFYDEGTPEVADWHIKYALEHGVQGFIYCWYRAGLEPEITQQLGHAIHDGLMQARYRDQFQFAIMWENGCGAGTSGREDLLGNLLPFWIKNYLSHPSYVRVDGKPLLVIWVPNKLTAELGGEEQTRQVLEEMRQRCREAGLGGLSIVGCVGSADRAMLEMMGREGWDASTAYGLWGESKLPPGRDAEGITTADYRSSILGEEAVWQGKRQVGALPDIIDVMMGWDPRPWHGKTTASYLAPASPEVFREACRRAKAMLDATPGNGLDQRVVVFDNWCEFGEGHYLEPVSGFGFAYLDAIKEVFCPGAPPCEDITPEDVGLEPPERAYQARREILGGFPDRQRTVVDHLVGWWSFDRDDEHVAGDGSACGFHGWKQGFEETEGRIGQAFLCNGGSVSLGPHQLLWPPDGITVELWFRPEVAGQSDRWMVNSVGAADTGYRLGLGDGKLCWQVPKTPWSHLLQAPEPVEIGKWQHVAATYDNDTMRLYLDGREVASVQRGGPINPSDSALCLGSYAPGHPRAFFQGALDEVRIWDRALAAAEIVERAGG